MGVDVYVFLEQERNGSWHFCGGLAPNPDYAYDCELPDYMPMPIFESTVKEYAAILTDSCNQIRATEPYTPVVPRRGKPKDCSPELAEWLPQFEDDPAASLNWFSLKELLDFDLASKVMKKTGMVSHDVAHLFEGCPMGFPGGAWSGGLASWRASGVTVEWMESYADSIREFYEMIPALTAMGQPAHLRLIVVASW
jgi:hypothetical protein